MEIEEVKEKPEVELSSQDLEKVNYIINQHKDEKGALMPVLQDINSDYHYLPENILKYVAQKLDVPLSQVFQVATFYNVFSLTPRGKYTIRACVGTSCHVRGSGRILDRLKKYLGITPGETTRDLGFSLETVRCVGCCALSPCVVINNKTYARLRPDAVSKLIKTYE
jgi:NADH:ubiquinone oxidoreductase subunit E